MIICFNLLYKLRHYIKFISGQSKVICFTVWENCYICCLFSEDASFFRKLLTVIGRSHCPSLSKSAEQKQPTGKRECPARCLEKVSEDCGAGL